MKFMLKRISLAAFCALCFSHNAYGISLGTDFVCHLSGHSQCNSGDWCMGSGAFDESLIMRIDLNHRTISLNGINGVFNPINSVVKGGDFYIEWTFNIISYRKIVLTQQNEKIIASLVDYDNSKISFLCN